MKMSSFVHLIQKQLHITCEPTWKEIKSLQSYFLMKYLEQKSKLLMLLFDENVILCPLDTKAAPYYIRLFRGQLKSLYIALPYLAFANFILFPLAKKLPLMHVSQFGRNIKAHSFTSSGKLGQFDPFSPWH